MIQLKSLWRIGLIWLQQRVVYWSLGALNDGTFSNTWTNFFFFFCTTVHVPSQRSGSYYVRHSINTLQDMSGPVLKRLQSKHCSSQTWSSSWWNNCRQLQPTSGIHCVNRAPIHKKKRGKKKKKKHGHHTLWCLLLIFPMCPGKQAAYKNKTGK